MLDRLIMDLADTQSSELRQYCKMEHVMLSTLVCAGKPKGTMRLRLEAAVCRMLQRMNKWLDSMINRLTADMEHSGRVQRRLS